MNTIRLKPKYQKIEKELIRNNQDNLRSDKAINAFVKMNALMIAQGLQLAEEYSEDKTE